ncbi:hypothetical protein EVG20_g8438, partial [Dentipellis fragilis]
MPMSAGSSSGVRHTPPEIWLLIFEHATFVPYALNTNVDDPFASPGAPIDPESQTQQKLQAALATKRSLVLVCKRWHDLATPILYEAVAAQSDHSLQCLRDTVVEMSHLSSTGTPVPRPRIRRFDLFRWQTERRKPSVRLLADIFSRMPDLEIFSESSFPMPMPGSDSG